MQSLLKSISSERSRVRQRGRSGRGGESPAERIRAGAERPKREEAGLRPKDAAAPLPDPCRRASGRWSGLARFTSRDRGQQYLDVPVVPGQLQVCKPPLQQTLSVHA
jgi:hypothetical protein